MLRRLLMRPLSSRERGERRLVKASQYLAECPSYGGGQQAGVVETQCLLPGPGPLHPQASAKVNRTTCQHALKLVATIEIRLRR